MTGNSKDSSTLTQRRGPAVRPRALRHDGRAGRHRGPCGRGGRRLLPALAGAAFATALLAGCGAADTEDPGEDPGTDGTEQSTSTDEGAETSASEEPTESDAPSGGDDSDGSDDSDDGDGGGGDGGGGDDGAGGENLFEGTWGFGHDTKTLDAEELADLLEEEAESRGPEEMSLDVECGDGVDTGVPDYTAECVAYADEGVEHVWLVTVGPADTGLVVEVENAS